MKKRAMKLASLCLTAGILCSAPVRIYADEAQAKQGVQTAHAEVSDLTGQLAFAQCEEYINIRSDADTESEITAKIYNNGAVTIVGQVGDWFEVTSGNAKGYVKAEYFATGEEAQTLAKELAYNVATVHPQDLNIRSGPGEEYGMIKVAHQADELEVVDYSGDWMKVALGGNEYGYVNAYYVSYDTYYPVAETLEEEQIRLEEERKALLAAQNQAEDSHTDDIYSDNSYTDDYDTDESWSNPDQETWIETEATQTEPVYTETEPIQTEPVYIETEPIQTEPSYTETEPVQTEPAYTETEPVQTEPAYTETEPVQTEPVYTETEPAYTETEPVQTEPAYTETEPVQTEPAYTETEPVQTEPAYTETEPVQTEPAYTETEPANSTGQSIADYAVQFVGNPYVWGGTSLTNGADCSGFVQSVFANFGIWLSRTAADQSYGGSSVSLDNLQAGDLVFYGSSGIDHVALYIGGGQVVHAANAKSGIIISDCYYNTPVSARRYW